MLNHTHATNKYATDECQEDDKSCEFQYRRQVATGMFDQAQEISRRRTVSSNISLARRVTPP